MFEHLAMVPERCSASGVLQRLVDTIGYRFRRALVGIEDEQLGWRPQVDVQSIDELIDHIGELIEATLAALERRERRRAVWDPFEIFDLLMRLHQVLDDYDDEDLALIDFSVAGLWTLINGPLADALTHIGQINMLKRLQGIDSPNGGYLRGDDLHVPAIED